MKLIGMNKIGTRKLVDQFTTSWLTTSLNCIRKILLSNLLL